MAGAPTYEFLPWVRSGIASTLTQPDTLDAATPGRARLGVTLGVSRRAGAALSVPQQLAVLGPGDVTGLDPRQVIRTDPLPGSTDAEPNYLVQAELDRPDLPWLFTPAAAGASQKLRPWLVLAVVAIGPGVVRSQPSSEGGLAVLDLHAEASPARQLPDLAESWAWAHGQAMLLPGESVGAVLGVAAQRDAARLLCPRRLDPTTHYLACIVPAFEAGRRAGLGLDPDPADELALRPAWTADASAVTLPIYYSWEFTTGSGGDFESMARALRPRPLPAGVGQQSVYVGAGGAPLAALQPGADGAIVSLAGALVLPQSTAAPWPAATVGAVQAGLKGLLDVPAGRVGTGGTASAGTGASAGGVDGDPAVTPPLYGQWPAARPTVPDAGTQPAWLRTLNLDPRRRAVAGLGSAIVAAEQERLMDEAWSQVGAVEQANRELRLAQLARAVRASLLRRHVAPLPAGDVLGLTAAVHRRMPARTATVAVAIAASALPDAVVTNRFRRTTGPTGALARRLQAPADRGPGQIAERLDSRALRIGVSGAPPDGLFGFASVAPARVGVAADVLTAITTARDAGSTEPPVRLDRAALSGVALTQQLAGQVSAAIGLSIRGQLGGGGSLGGAIVASAAAPIAGGRATGGGRLVGGGGDVVAGGGAVAAGGAAGGGAAAGGLAGGILTGGTATAVAIPATIAALTQLRDAVVTTTALSDALVDIAPDPPAPALGVTAIAKEILGRLDPNVTVLARMAKRVRRPPARPERDPLEQIQAAPVFAQPAWELVRDHAPDLLLPGLHRIAQDSVTLAQTNPAFAEAALVGLNHEVARELLWREYPTDQRGTCFARFWAPDGADDIPPIHSWTTGELGAHTAAQADGRLVLVIRGRLLFRYPHTVIYAAPDRNGRPDLSETAVLLPTFRGRIDPDITFCGFALRSEDARATPGWWFILEEQPTAPRFGLDVAERFGADARPVNQWNDLSWGHLAADAAGLPAITQLRADMHPPSPPTGPRWGTTSSAMASILAQQPVRVAMRGVDLLPPDPVSA